MPGVRVEGERRGLLLSHLAECLLPPLPRPGARTPANRLFVDRFQREHGEDRVISSPVEAAYVAVHLWRLAVERAGSTDVATVRAALQAGIEYAAPSGPMRLDPKTQHLAKYCRIGRIRADRQFEILYESPRPIAPEPYPQVAFPGWHCDWTQGGITQGEPVRIGP